MRSRSSSTLMNFGVLFREHKFSTANISHTFCQSATKLAAGISCGQPSDRGRLRNRTEHLVDGLVERDEICRIDREGLAVHQGQDW